jgi:hypothetical protein
MFRIICFSHLSIHPTRTVTPDNRAYTAFLTFTVLKNTSYTMCTIYVLQTITLQS